MEAEPKTALAKYNQSFVDDTCSPGVGTYDASHSPVAPGTNGSGGVDVTAVRPSRRYKTQCMGSKLPPLTC